VGVYRRAPPGNKPAKLEQPDPLPSKSHHNLVAFAYQGQGNDTCLTATFV
jgi:hypothetical protein